MHGEVDFLIQNSGRMCVDAGVYCESWGNIGYGHVFKGCGEFKNEMQGPLVWGRVLAARA